MKRHLPWLAALLLSAGTALAVTLGNLPSVSSLADTDRLPLETAAGASKSISVANARTSIANASQPLDSDLTALAGTASTGLYAVTGVGTSAVRSIAGDGTVITSVTNGNGVSGNPTPVFDGDITALAGAANGIAARTGTNAWAARTITAGSSANLVVTNGDGISGNPTIEAAYPSIVSYLTAAFTSTSTTAAPSGISMALTSGHYYNVRCAVPYAPGATTTGIGLAFVIPASTTSANFQMITNNTAANNAVIASNAAGYQICTTGGSGTTGTSGCTFTDAPSTSVFAEVTIQGHIKAGSTGNLVLEMYSEVAGSNFNAKVGSFCVAQDMGT